MARSENQLETGKGVARFPLSERLGQAKGPGNEHTNRMGNREIQCKRLLYRNKVFFNASVSLTVDHCDEYKKNICLVKRGFGYVRP